MGTTSYVRFPSSFPLAPFRVSAPELNRTLFQVPYRHASPTPCEDKTDYHSLLFELEDQLLSKDFDLFQLRHIKSQVQRALQLEGASAERAKVLEKVTKNPIYTAVKVEKLDSKEDLEGLERNIAKLEQLTRDKRAKLSGAYPTQVAKFLPGALDQLLFNVKRNDLKPLLNKTILEMIGTRFLEHRLTIEPEVYCSVEDMELDWEEALKSERERSVKAGMLLPLLSRNAYQRAHNLIVANLSLNKVFLKVFGGG